MLPMPASRKLIDNPVIYMSFRGHVKKLHRQSLSFSFTWRQSLEIAQPVPGPSAKRGASSHASLRQRINAFAVFATLACFTTTSCTRTQVALSVTAMAAVVVGTTVGVTLAVQNHRHTLQGCVSSGPSGLQLRTIDSKVYRLEGSAANLKVGDRLKLHGSKLKSAKGSSGDQVFVVEKVSKDYGHCPADASAAAAPTR
jgi:hypothetical protein